MRHFLSLGAVGALLVGICSQAQAAPCGPAVLSSASGQVLVNRGAGFLSGTAGMPLAVGDYVMVRGGSADILYVNGTGSSLKGAASTAIVACSVDGASLTSPALAQVGAPPAPGVFNVPGAAPTAVSAPTGGAAATAAATSIPAAVVPAAVAGPTLVVGTVAVAGIIGGVAAVASNSGSSGGNAVVTVPNRISP